MKKFTRIVASTDLSPEGASAVQYAGHLAQAQGAKLIIVHVPQSTSMLFTDLGIPADLASLDAEIQSAAREQLERWVARHLKKLSGVETVLETGVTHEVICEVAARKKASVIVMATHGRRGLAHALLGSVTERVLRDAPCPVLVVRPPAKPRKASKAAKATKASKK
ncbi:MAG: universal stress protein A [Hyphomicrobiaceae bacterium]